MRADLASLSDESIASLIESIRSSGNNINLGIPYMPETVNLFNRMFNCRRCGLCCRGEGISIQSGVVLSSNEVETLAGALGLPRSRFKEDYTYVKDTRRIMKYPCPFNEETSHVCRIYSKRPQVCQNFPLHAPAPAPDGNYLLVVAALCPEGRRVAVEFLKMQRDVTLSVKEMNPPEQEKMKQASRALWHDSLQKQREGEWFKRST